MGFAVLAFRGGGGGVRKRNVLRQIRATSSAKVRDRAGGSGGGADHRLEWCRCLRQRCAQAASNYSGCDRKGKFGGGRHWVTGSWRKRQALGPLDHCSCNPIKCKQKQKNNPQKNAALVKAGVRGRK